MTDASILLSWKWRSDAALVVMAFGTVYLVGWYRLQRRDPRAAPGWRVALYLGGLVALCLALLSPIDPLGSLLFFVHMMHWTPAYEASLRSEVVHDAQHLSFFVTALLFWWPVINPAPMLHGHRHHAIRVAYVIPAAFQSQLLGLIFAFSSRVFYSHYEAVPRLWGFTALQDQSAAGLLMMQVEGLIYLGTVLILVGRMFSYEARMTRLREEHGFEP